MDSIQKHIYVLILAGGGGTRLWPYSREDSPKQFAQLFAGKSLYELTLARAKKLTSPSRIFISTSVKYFDFVCRSSRGIPLENIIPEPIRRDTALAHGLGALYIYHRDPEAAVINLASDHLISPISTFIVQMKTAAKIAFDTNQYVAVGISPLFPHTGMGYIKFKKQVGLKFVEKPQLALAQKYTASRQYLWNANLYVYRAKLYLDLLKKHSPKTFAMFPKIATAIGTDREKQVISLAFQMAPSISIDYAVSEKLKSFVCLKAQFNWTDVGDWQEVWKNLPQDKLGNVISGPHGQGQYIGIDSLNNLLFLDKQLVATAGVSDMVIVDTPDAILICPRNDSQAVKKIVQALKDQKLLEYT
ncbi:mannose-1-phosphate guanylyltransferase [Candidatus Amesbacteria bacterium]|nr:mannose-1-phosphate guanylyltransferase [Candidatus Amesbacteria bacterium]